MPAAATQRLILVDAYSLIFQVFHAIPLMTSPAGLPVNALFGYTRDLLYLRGQRPTWLIAVYDDAAPTFREGIYPDYKAHREPPPDDLSIQVPLTFRMLKGLGVPALSVPG